MQLSVQAHAAFSSKQSFCNIFFSFTDLFNRQLKNEVALDFNFLIKALQLSTGYDVESVESVEIFVFRMETKHSHPF
jgi:hypothetical protein